MQIRNNYDIVWCKGGDTAAIMAGEMAPGSAPETGTGIFNGDLGTILRIDTENELIWIDFDEKLAWYGFEQLGELDHAFAVTVHKAQGSEYRAVVLAAGRAPGTAFEPRSSLYRRHARERASRRCRRNGDRAGHDRKRPQNAPVQRAARPSGRRGLI